MVEGVRDEWPGCVEYAVRLAARPWSVGSSQEPGAGSSQERGLAGRVVALGYLDLVGRAQPGDRVLLNTAALERGLGTGGAAMVVAVPERLPPDPFPGPGHVVKARYTPLQPMVLGVDEQESEWHELLREADSIAGLPVVVADLHSAVPAIIAGLRQLAPNARVAYLMTDGGALPMAYSRTVATLRAAGWLAGTVSIGQAYGGDAEAVTLHSGLLAARHVMRADVAVVAQGPGNLGTGTRWGFSGVVAGEVVNATATLEGRAVASLRISQADPRPRHQGISHHSSTAYGRVALAPADLPVPLLDNDFGEMVRAQAADLAAGSAGRLRLVEISLDGLGEALAHCPVRLRTMGRDLSQDPAAFLAAAAAGRHAASLLGAGGLS